ncbi:MAG: class I SAM-dependent methyltransferase [Halobacteriota archaeon]|uniref:class I SAM-dependent methyltransferase n=1 Tax=Natronomonas sp. TaxID=2184060 RepID=UPI0039762958
MNELAAIVERSRTESVVEALGAEGVYDRSRRIESYDADRTAIPVLDAPRSIAVDAVERVGLPRRERGLRDLLDARGASDEIIDAAPSSWAVIGSVVLVDFGDVSAKGTLDPTACETVGEALLELHGEADTVFARGGISGTRRDPSGKVVAGIGETETIHAEHGTRYALDLAEVMFSPGNKAERARMGEVVEPGERVFDMFAGIGYFTLPMARESASVTAAEIDPVSYRWLVENAQLNGVTDDIRAVLGDCRTVETTADRVVMGYYDAHEYLGPALDSLVPGGTVHLHEATPEARFPDRPIDSLRTAAQVADRTVDVLETRLVKTHSAGVVHGVVDAKIE